MIAERNSRPPRSGGGRAALIVLGFMAAATSAIAARTPIVRIAPSTAAAYASLGLPVNVRGLAIDGVQATIAGPTGDGRELIVSGKIVNLRGAETSVPDLRVALHADDGRELYFWTARQAQTRLAAHERIAFKARLAAPPAGARDVLVKFAAPGDKASFTE